MRTFLSEEVLVAAYWRKLARSIERPDVEKSRAASQRSLQKDRSVSGSELPRRPGVRQRVVFGRNAHRQRSNHKPSRERLADGGAVASGRNVKTQSGEMKEKRKQNTYA